MIASVDDLPGVGDVLRQRIVTVLSPDGGELEAVTRINADPYVLLSVPGIGAQRIVRILTEPENALTRQYVALVGAEKRELVFTDDAIAELARTAWQANDRMENIGARRLHTVMAALMEDLLFDLPNNDTSPVRIDAAAVKAKLAEVVKDDDLRKYIL